MVEENKVVLHGMWASPFVFRVKLAFKIKGIPFDYVEEDLMNKSPLFLKYNPVYKKVPVLVHNGRPISESLVILEYIDEVWKNIGPRLLPEDPYKRAQVRFWADFIQKKVSVMMTKGEAQEKAIKELTEQLKTFEDGLKNLFPEGNRFVNGVEMGYLDIVTFSVLGSYKTEEEFLGVKYIEEEKIPGIYSWLTSLSEHPIVKAILPPKEKIVGLLQFVRQNVLQSPAV